MDILGKLHKEGSWKVFDRDGVISWSESVTVGFGVGLLEYSDHLCLLQDA